MQSEVYWASVGALGTEGYTALIGRHRPFPRQFSFSLPAQQALLNWSNAHDEQKEDNSDNEQRPGRYRLYRKIIMSNRQNST